MNCSLNVTNFSQKMKLCTLSGYLFLAVSLFGAGAAYGACLVPQQPFLPSGNFSMIEYKNLIKADFESYFAAAQNYFLCLDRERRQVFEEVQQTSEEFGRFLRAVAED